MIQNIRVEIDGFTYNIMQMTGEKAFHLQLRIMNLISEFNVGNISDKKDNEMLLVLVQGLLRAVNPDIILPIVKELLATVGVVEVNKQFAESEGFNAERHFNKKVMLDNFMGKDMIHLYRLLYEVLKANYEEFFFQVRKWLASNLAKVQAPLTTESAKPA